MNQKDFLADFMRDVARGDATRFKREQRIPEARWQTPSEIYNQTNLNYDPKCPGGKIMIGALRDRLIGIEDNRHILTVAGGRSGKSVTLVNNLHFYDKSAFILDPKNELAVLTAQRRADRGQRVHVLEPFHRAPASLDKFRASYNPLTVLWAGSRSIIEDAELIADAIVITSPGTKDPHWDESAKQFIIGIILHVATAPEYDGRRHLVMVRTLINNALLKEAVEDVPSGAHTPPEAFFALQIEMLDNAVTLREQMDTGDAAHAIAAACNNFYEKDDKERAAVLSTIRRHTQFLDYTSIRSVIQDHDFDLADLKRSKNGVTVYLCLPALQMGTCNRWLRILVNQLLDAMEREKSVSSAPVLCCLDEFPVLGYMKQLEDAAGQIASFGVKLWVFLQDWGQGKALYKDRWETFVGNAGILQFFGNNDVATTEYISRRLGKTPVTVARQGEVGTKQSTEGLTGAQESTDLYDLMTPEEITRFFSRTDRLKRQLVILAGQHPMILQRVEYYDRKGPFANLFDRAFRAG